MYFGKEVKKAIDEYNRTDNPIQKELIYSKTIYPALSKLVENNIYKHINQKTGIFYYGLNSYSDLKHEFIVHLNDQLFRYSPEKGNAFSYFNRINIHHIYSFLNDLTKMRNISGIDVENNSYEKSDVSILDTSRNIDMEVAEENIEDDLHDFCQRWSRWGINHLDFLFPSKRDRKIANAIFNLFLNCELIDIYNKKALYIMIREQVDTKTQYITQVIKVLKKLQKDMWSEYQRNGTRYWYKYILIDNEEK